MFPHCMLSIGHNGSQGMTYCDWDRLVQRCQTVFFRSPHLWRINMPICHIFKIPAKSLDKSTNVMDYQYPRPSLFLPFQFFLTEKCELNWKYLNLFKKKINFSTIQNQSHSPHVASGEWVGQHCSKVVERHTIKWPSFFSLSQLLGFLKLSS